MKRAVAGFAAALILVAVTACGTPAKEVTPQACIDAIDHSSEIIKLTAEVIDVNTRANNKQITSDAAAEAIGVLQPKIQAAGDAWLAASEECRAKQ